jgi:hypothetical protein
VLQELLVTVTKPLAPHLWLFQMVQKRRPLGLDFLIRKPKTSLLVTTVIRLPICTDLLSRTTVQPVSLLLILITIRVQALLLIGLSTLTALKVLQALQGQQALLVQLPLWLAPRGQLVLMA